MPTKVIPLKDLQADPEHLLRECCDSGLPLVVELPDERRVTIQPFDENDDLVDRLIETNPAFRQLLAKSAQSPVKPFRIPRTKSRKSRKKKTSAE